jgi:hypothetical protein
VTEIVGRSNVGKTLLCYHIAAVLAVAKHQVIVADCDGRWNVTKLKEIIVHYSRASMLDKSEWTNEMVEMETVKALKSIRICKPHLTVDVTSVLHYGGTLASTFVKEMNTTRWHTSEHSLLHHANLYLNETTQSNELTNEHEESQSCILIIDNLTAFDWRTDLDRFAHELMYHLQSVSSTFGIVATRARIHTFAATLTYTSSPWSKNVSRRFYMERNQSQDQCSITVNENDAEKGVFEFLLQ